MVHGRHGSIKEEHPYARQEKHVGLQSLTELAFLALNLCMPECSGAVDQLVEVGRYPSHRHLEFPNTRMCCMGLLQAVTASCSHVAKPIIAETPRMRSNLHPSKSQEAFGSGYLRFR